MALNLFKVMKAQFSTHNSIVAAFEFTGMVRSLRKSFFGGPWCQKGWTALVWI